MLFITQLIYIKEGQEEIFHQFENHSIPIISKYNGRLLIRTRPNSHTIIERNIELPYEIHIIEFGTEADFGRFMKDEQRKSFLHLKELSIKSSFLVKGERI